MICDGNSEIRPFPFVQIALQIVFSIMGASKMADLVVVHDSGSGRPILLNRDAIACAREGGSRDQPVTTVELTVSISIRESIEQVRSIKA
jgi:hypothetical protein